MCRIPGESGTKENSLSVSVIMLSPGLIGLPLLLLLPAEVFAVTIVVVLLVMVADAEFALFLRDALVSMDGNSGNLKCISFDESSLISSLRVILSMGDGLWLLVSLTRDALVVRNDLDNTRREPSYEAKNAIV